ncbi:hypothetical protein ACIQUM_36935 [Amycolatopsis azurea]|uniref:AbiTii domain-containing protein n=1 Tax=Amycolatopsis azurea TaxID=36819 RepID=UPI0038127B1E
MLFLTMLLCLVVRWCRRRLAYSMSLRLGVLDDRVSLSSILRKCVVLGGRAGSEKVRDRASLELKGYRGRELPEYRQIPASLFVKVTNSARYNPVKQRL